MLQKIETQNPTNNPELVYHGLTRVEEIIPMNSATENTGTLPIELSDPVLEAIPAKEAVTAFPEQLTTTDRIVVGAMGAASLVGVVAYREARERFGTFAARLKEYTATTLQGLANVSSALYKESKRTAVLMSAKYHTDIKTDHPEQLERELIDPVQDGAAKKLKPVDAAQESKVTKDTGIIIEHRSVDLLNPQAILDLRVSIDRAIRHGIRGMRDVGPLRQEQERLIRSRTTKGLVLDYFGLKKLKDLEDPSKISPILRDKVLDMLVMPFNKLQRLTKFTRDTGFQRETKAAGDTFDTKRRQREWLNPARVLELRNAIDEEIAKKLPDQKLFGEHSRINESDHGFRHTVIRGLLEQYFGATTEELDKGEKVPIWLQDKLADMLDMPKHELKAQAEKRDLDASTKTKIIPILKPPTKRPKAA